MKNDIYVKISLIEIALQIKHELMELVVLGRGMIDDC
jgi:hypothetical protein